MSSREADETLVIGDRHIDGAAWFSPNPMEDAVKARRLIVCSASGYCARSRWRKGRMSRRCTRMVETNSNFGFSVSWWDRLCGTYRAQPAFGQVGMDIGLSEYRTPLHLGQLLLLPFRNRTGHATNAGARATDLQGRDAA